MAGVSVLTLDLPYLIVELWPGSGTFLSIKTLFTLIANFFLDRIRAINLRLSNTSFHQLSALQGSTATLASGAMGNHASTVRNMF